MNKVNIKESNRSRVIQYVRKNVITDRQAISSFLNINISTAKRIVDDLVEENIVVYLGENESTGGRKSTKIGINYDYGYNVVIKIEVDRIIFTLVNFKPKALKHVEFEYELGSTFDEISSKMQEHLVKMVVESNSAGKTLFSVGVAISGVVSRDSSTLISSTLLGWYNINFKEIIEKWVKIPTYVENDVNCAVIAEHWFGKGMGLDSFVLITLGKGTGSGIILNNLLYKGSFGGAGEIGHSIFQKNGRKCYCGQRGCLEMYTNEAYLIDTLEENTGIKAKDSKELKLLLDSKNDGILKTLNEFEGNIVSGIINMMVVLEPQRIIIGGELAFVFDYIKHGIIKSVNSNWINSLHEANMVDVVKSDLGSENFVMGLAVKLMSKVFENQ